MISNLTQESWDAKTIELGGSILQSWNYGEFQKALGFRLQRFSGVDYINQVIEIPLLAGKTYLYSPRGPLGNFESAKKDFDEMAAKDSKIVFTRVEPQQKLDLPKGAKETQPTNNWMLDLAQTEEQILAGMKPKTRYNINLAERKGVTVREGKKEDLLTVYKLLLETAGRGKFRLHPQNYYWEIWEHLQPHNLRILIAEYEGKPLACMILTMFGHTATYLHGGSSQIMKEAMAPYLLHWEAIKLSKSLGMETYDFGGVAPENIGQHSWSGISRFKRSFGGFEVVYPGSFEIVYSPLWYNVYKNARKLRNLIKT
jgi:lipid II:glycine glycyltransferase (peptidoglycan interpeptide bridge formation enzyme)